MSLIPQRRHTPEELAALREKELREKELPPVVPAVVPKVERQKNSGERPADDAVPLTPERKRYITPKKHGVFHGFEGLRPDAATHPEGQDLPDGVHGAIPQAHAHLQTAGKPRMGQSEKSGQVHAFEGLRPDADSQAPAGHDAVAAHIPERKHDDREIMHMRRRDMYHIRPPVQQIKSMALNRFVSGSLYIGAAVIIFLSIHFWKKFPPENYIAPGVGSVLLLLASLWIYLKKPRARHHAAFLFGIACVIIGFVILLTVKNPYAP
jgi:hypothetical protein